MICSHGCKQYFRIMKHLIIIVFLLSVIVGSRAWPSHPVPKQDTLKILNWNVLYAFNHGKKVKEGAGWIKEQKPDVVVLQELNGQTHESFKKMAASWGHGFSALLKEDGFPIGITSDAPIVVIEKKVRGFHHGYLHITTHGIHLFAVHLWPDNEKESLVIPPMVKDLIARGERVVVLGDFNAESPLDDKYLKSKPKLNSKVSYTVMRRFLDAGLHDVVHKHDKNALITQPSPIVIPKWQPDMAAVEAMQRRIDFILVSKNLLDNSLTATILRSKALDEISDHYPVIAGFMIDKKTE